MGGAAFVPQFLSSIVITAFIVIHLIQFKFGTEYKTNAAADGPLKGAEVRDLARLEDEIFAGDNNLGASQGTGGERDRMVVAVGIAKMLSLAMILM